MINDVIIDVVRKHAAATDKRECCGVIIIENDQQIYVPCRNIAARDEHFDIHEEDWIAAEDRGEVIAICHSHPYEQPEPSQADLTECEVHGVEWLIVNHPLGHYKIIAPTGYVTPLIGRDFSEGILDCLSLARDYYAEKQPQIVIPRYSYERGWLQRGKTYFMDHYEECGFVKVTDGSLKAYDAILMMITTHETPDHCGVITPEGKLIHHMYGQKSREAIYGGWYRKCTAAVLRHRSLF